MERLNQQVALELARLFDVAVIGPRGCANHLQPISRIYELTLRPLPFFFLGLFFRVILESLRFRPKLVIAGSGLTAPFAWAGARLIGARAMVYLHGLDVVVQSRIYRRLWLPFIRHCDTVLVNSSYTAKLAEGIGVYSDRISVLNPGMTIPRPILGAAEEFRRSLDLGSRPLLLSVGRLTRRKGLLEFVERALPLIKAELPEVSLIVIGDDAPDALSGKGSALREEIVSTAHRLGLSENLRLIGSCDDATLSAAFVAAQVHVFPVREVSSDIEGFGMVALEAAAHGLRTIAFAVGGVTDAVAEGRSGSLIPAGDYVEFAEATLRSCTSICDDVARQACRDFAAPFRWEIFGERLRKLAGDAIF